MKSVLLKVFIVFAISSVSATLLLTLPNQLSNSIPFTFAEVKTDENVVYSTIFKELFIKDDTKFLIISNQTMWNGNSTPNLTYNLDIPIKYILINGADYDHKVLVGETNKNDNNKPKIMDLLKKYPNAVYVGLSKIDFNEERNKAFVYVESFGQGRKVSLEKKSSFWKIKEVSEIWVS